MLPCVCSVIDHRWRQNVVRTKQWHTRLLVCHCFVLTTFWCHLWSITEQTHGNMESICFIQKKHTTSAFYFKIFLNYYKAGLCPLWQARKKAIWHNLLSIQNEAISLIAMHNEELWLVKKNHATVKLHSNGSSWNENLQRKQNWTAKFANVKNKCQKNQLSFCHQNSVVCRRTWMFPWILLEVKECARKTRGCSQHWTPFDSSFQRKEGYQCSARN